jgi:hypothetical protein
MKFYHVGNQVAVPPMFGDWGGIIIDFYFGQAATRLGPSRS